MGALISSRRAPVDSCRSALHMPGSDRFRERPSGSTCWRRSRARAMRRPIRSFWARWATTSGTTSIFAILARGIALKMLVDQRLGAELSAMFLVEYQPGGVAHAHDHPLEESYFILEGEIEAVADDRHYLLRAGDVFWTGVGCIHGFRNASRHRVRWLETQSPQLPARYGYRFNRDWEYLADRLAAQSDMRAA